MQSISLKALTLEGLRQQGVRMVGDPARLAQAVRNVLANAVRYAPSGSAILAELLEGDTRIELRIGDRGPGIPPNELEAVFETFAQSSLTGDGAGGTGLGLPITRGIVELHQGHIRAENRAGGGALFVIELPRQGR